MGTKQDYCTLVKGFVITPPLTHTLSFYLRPSQWMGMTQSEVWREREILEHFVKRICGEATQVYVW